MNWTSKKKALFVAEAAENKKAEHINILDLKKLSYIADFFVIMSGNSGPHLLALKDTIEEKLSAVYKPREEIDSSQNWILLDYGDVVVHIFKPEARKYYALERFWGDAKQISPHHKKQQKNVSKRKNTKKY